MRRRTVLLLLLAAAAGLSACSSSPRKDFDEGVLVHFILFRKRPPSKDVTLRPIFTVGESVIQAPEVVFGPEHALAIGTAKVRAQRGDDTRIAFWDPLTRTGSRDSFNFEHELWVLIDVGNLGPDLPAPLLVYDYPPNVVLQDWAPLVQMPD